MLFDERRYLREISEGQINSEMRPSEGSDGAIRAIPPPSNSTSSTAGPFEGAHSQVVFQGAAHPEAKRKSAISEVSRNGTFRAGPDPDALLALLRDRGPLSYGAAASALGWGATRAWQAEAALKAAGRIEHDRIGRAAVAAVPSPESDL